MALKNRTELYTYFNTGDIPTETQLHNLIDSFQLDCMVDIRNFGAVGGGADDTVAIQDALDYVNSVGGGIVFIPLGSWYITASLVIYDYTHLMGCGRGSILTTDQDIEMIVTDDGMQYSFITHLYITNTLSGQSKFNIHGINPNGLTISHCWIVNHATGTNGGVCIDNGAGAAASGYYTEIGFTHITHGIVDIFQTDGKYYKNWVFSHERTWAFYVRTPGHVLIEGCDIIGGVYPGGGVYADGSKGLNVTGCLFGSNVDGQDTGRGVVLANAYFCSVSNNHFYHCTQDSVRVENCQHCKIEGNLFEDTNHFRTGSGPYTWGNNSSDVVLYASTGKYCLDNVVVGNVHKIILARDNKGYACLEIADGAQPNYNIISSNSASGNYLFPHFLIDRSASGSFIGNNAGAAIDIHYGSEVVTTGVTSFAVTFAVNTYYTPRASDIHFVFTVADPGGLVWLSAISAAGFTVHFSTATPAGLVINYKVKIE